MHRLDLLKVDGRELYLYARSPLQVPLSAPSPPGPWAAPDPHMRWHPLRGEWVTYAPNRQDRTFLPPPEYNPFAVTRDETHPTELPPGNWEIAVFENRFPAFHLDAREAPAVSGVATLPAKGRCEVVVFTQDPNASLGALSLEHLTLLMDVWADRCEALGRRPDIEYVLPFENRGIEVGVTLHHPHGQIYAYPVVPPIPARMHSNELSYYAEHGRSLLPDLIANELEFGERVLYRGDSVVAFVPAWARYPYEVWVSPIAPVSSLKDLDPITRAEFARALKTVMLKYDGLWQRVFPYLMAWFQAPCDGREHPESQVHVEFYPPYRTRDRLKYLAGTELAAGLFAMDAMPEEKARELQAIDVRVDR